MNTNLIKDKTTRDSIIEINRHIQRVEDIQQLPSNASLADVIEVLNKITNSTKR